MRSPAKRWEQGMILAAMLFFALVVFLINGTRYFEFLDDGAASLGALRILKGDLPYRDFMTGIAPAHFYVLALLYKIFSPAFMVERVWQSVVWVLGVWAMTSLCRKTARAEAAAIAGLWMVGLVGSFRHIPGGLPSALSLSAASGVFLVNALSRQNGRWVAAAAAASALSALFRHDLGVFTAAAVLGVLGAFRSQAPRGSFKIFAATFFGVLVLPAVYFLTQVPFSDLWFSFIRYPFVIYSKHCRLTYPPFGQGWTSLLFYGTPLLLVYGWGWVIWTRRQKNTASAQSAAMLFSVLLASFFFNQVRLRADMIHVLSPSIASAPLYACLCDHLLNSHRGRRFALFVILPALFLVFQAAGIAASVVSNHPPMRTLDIPRMEGIRIPAEDPRAVNEFAAYAECVRYVQAHVPAQEKIFVASTRQDRVCYGDPAFYFISDRASATRHQELNRGVVNTAPTQAQIIEELKRNDVKVIVLRASLDFCSAEPNASSESSGVRDLDYYMRDHYSVAQNFGGNLVLVRKDVPVRQESAAPA